MPLLCSRAWRVSCERRSLKLEDKTTYANRGLNSLRETKKLRVCITKNGGGVKGLGTALGKLRGEVEVFIGFDVANDRRFPRIKAQKGQICCSQPVGDSHWQWRHE